MRTKYVGKAHQSPVVCFLDSITTGRKSACVRLERPHSSLHNISGWPVRLDARSSVCFQSRHVHREPSRSTYTFDHHQYGPSLCTWRGFEFGKDRSASLHLDGASDLICRPVVLPLEPRESPTSPSSAQLSFTGRSRDRKASRTMSHYRATRSNPT